MTGSSSRRASCSPSRYSSSPLLSSFVFPPPSLDPFLLIHLENFPTLHVLQYNLASEHELVEADGMNAITELGLLALVGLKREEARAGFYIGFGAVSLESVYHFRDARAGPR
jgi:hypothetical protein